MGKTVQFSTTDSMERLLGLIENLDYVWDLHITDDDLSDQKGTQVEK